MPDELDAAIAKARDARDRAREQADKWVRQVEIEEVRIEALEQAARIRPAMANAMKPKPEKTVGRGRLPGAISKTWRNILKVLALTHPDGAVEEEIADIARTAGLLNIRPKDVRVRMATYETHGYVELLQNRWHVTAHATSKFSEHLEGPEQAGDDDDETALHDSHLERSDQGW